MTNLYDIILCILAVCLCIILVICTVGSLLTDISFRKKHKSIQEEHLQNQLDRANTRARLYEEMYNNEAIKVAEYAQQVLKDKQDYEVLWKRFLRLFKPVVEYGIRCPNCNDEYKLKLEELHAGGWEPVQCMKCGHTYKQAEHIHILVTSDDPSLKGSNNG